MDSDNQQLTCSLIIPAYNAEKTITVCLDSALSQSIPKDSYEIIVVDDGSSDNTASVVSKYDSVKLIKQRNQGPATARNHGAKEAKGNILIFTDSDCELDVDFIKNLLYEFDENPEIAGVQGRYKTKQKEFIAQFCQVEIETRYHKMEQNRYIDFIGTYAAAYRASIFAKYGGFDTSFPTASGEDTEFSYRLSGDGYKLVFSNTAFVYHLHPSKLKKYLRIKFYRGFWRVRLYKKHIHKMVKDSYTPQTLKIEILISPILPLFFILSYWNVYLLIPAILIVLFFFFSSIPFLRLYHRDKYSRGYFLAFMLYARAISIFCGLCFGTLNELLSGNKN